MQILDVPLIQQDMVAAVSLKGICFLNGTRYKKRHKGAPDYVQQPTIGFVDKATYKLTHPQEYATKHRRTTQPKPVCSRTPRGYKIDKKAVTHRILGFVNSMPGTKRLHLWTITFKPGTSDAACFHLLRKWLQRMVTDEGLKHYCRITERQKNGMIHFHLAVNQWFDVKRANRYMRAAMMRSVDNGEISMARDDIKKYNGVDICKNKQTRRVVNFAKKKSQKALSNYLAKYVTKNNETFPQLAWHNSRTYTNVIISVQLTQSEYNKSGLQRRLDMEFPLVSEWFTFYRWKGQPPDTVANYLAFVTNHINNLN
jgi:hypothetical protein